MDIFPRSVLSNHNITAQVQRPLLGRVVVASMRVLSLLRLLGRTRPWAQAPVLRRLWQGHNHLAVRAGLIQMRIRQARATRSVRGTMVLRAALGMVLRITAAAARSRLRTAVYQLRRPVRQVSSDPRRVRLYAGARKEATSILLLAFEEADWVLEHRRVREEEQVVAALQLLRRGARKAMPGGTLAGLELGGCLQVHVGQAPLGHLISGRRRSLALKTRGTGAMGAIVIESGTEGTGSDMDAIAIVITEIGTVAARAGLAVASNPGPGPAGQACRGTGLLL